MAQTQRKDHVNTISSLVLVPLGNPGHLEHKYQPRLQVMHCARIWESTCQAGFLTLLSHFSFSLPVCTCSCVLSGLDCARYLGAAVNVW